MGIIINGVYHSDKSPEDIEVSKTIRDLYQDNKITREAKSEAHNLIQPNNRDGTPNPDFINYYPDSSKDHGFIKEEENQNNDQAI